MKRMGLTSIVIALLLAALPQASGVDRKAAVLLQAAQVKDTIQGDTKGAIPLYQLAFEEAKTDRVTAAKALRGLAKAYEKTGGADAQGTFARIVREFADQKTAAAEARSRLATIPTEIRQGDTLRTRQILSTESFFVRAVSADGRFAVSRDSGGVVSNLVLRDLVSGQTTRLAANSRCPVGREVLMRQAHD